MEVVSHCHRLRQPLRPCVPKGGGRPAPAGIPRVQLGGLSGAPQRGAGRPQEALRVARKALQ
eukprot:2171194-Alexandrium_andersonii.AAC.1